MIKYALVLAALLAGVANADELDLSMPKTDFSVPAPAKQKYPLALELTFVAAEAADMMTTLDIKNHPNLQEENPILGHHPSQAGIVAWCGVAATTHAIITKIMVDHGMSPKFVRVWEYVSIATEGGFAAHNYSIGLRFKL